MKQPRSKREPEDPSIDEATFQAVLKSGKIIPLGSFGLGPLEQCAQSLQHMGIYYGHCLRVQRKLEIKHKKLVRVRKWFDLAILCIGLISSLSGFAALVNYLSSVGIWTVASALVAVMAILRPYFNMDGLIERYLLGSSSYMRAAQEIDALLERTGGYKGAQSLSLFREQSPMLTQRVRELDSQFVDFLDSHNLSEAK